jgi:hypothetical protein
MNVFHDVGQIIIAVNFPSLEIAYEQVAHSFLLLIECLRVGAEKVRKLFADVLTRRVARANRNINGLLNFN